MSSILVSALTTIYLLAQVAYFQRLGFIFWTGEWNGASRYPIWLIALTGIAIFGLLNWIRSWRMKPLQSKLARIRHERSKRRKKILVTGPFNSAVENKMIALVAVAVPLLAGISINAAVGMGLYITVLLFSFDEELVI